ncbi:MAG: GHKL domain-containing protein, partial [Lachnospiraceae bacterium]|nr:GHKL domain-containing protein [Lachnospiraceae bacterium]
FQIFVSVGEIAFTYVVSKINPNFLTTADKSILYNTMNSGSKFVLLILCICVSFISKKGSGIHTVGHNIMLLSTPIITLCIFCVVPIKNFYKDDSNFFDALFVCLAALNVVNFVLINRSLSFDEMKFKNAQMEQQLFFQKEKYNQLSEAYRQNRRIIHDVKKHYFSIGEYINHNDLKGLLEYTNTAAKDLEATYVKYNTGNLVIDSFLTNYSNLFSANHIEFVARLNVECARVPVNDYDLCIILGNILDNAFNACKKAESFENNFLIEIETTNNDKFRIHTENAMPKVEESTENLKKSSINHGFGLENIKKTVKENNGFVTISTDEVFILDILIPIMDESMRVSKAN